MHGPYLSMPAAFDTTPTFSRSHSFPDLPSLPSLPDVNHIRDEELPRAASYTSIPALETLHYTVDKQAPILPPSSSNENKNGVGEREDNTRGTAKEELPKVERVGRRKSLVARPKSWISSLKQQSPETSHKTPDDIPPVPTLPKATRSKSKSVSESFATFARKSWISSSRSPSPNRRALPDTELAEDHGESLKPGSNAASSSSPSRSSVTQPRIEKPSPAILAISPSKLSRRTSTLQKIKQRPQSVLMSFTTFTSTNSSTSSLPRSSLDNRSTPRTSTDKIPPVPSIEKFQNLSLESPRRRDELWSAFRSLDNDFTKFKAKTWSLKTNVVRAQLLPFLKNHASHSLNKNLRPEDLDRRVVVLNKWWRGLLDVLDCRQNQTVSGVDRPVLLEAAAAIMTRPEWRSDPYSSVTLCDPSIIPPDGSSLRKKRSSSSGASSASQFLSDSVHHNIRNLFIENLLSQMRFVVDKMSLRHAPASLVIFCGKACAYAFFFVPGVANMLVRLWNVQPECLRKVSDELGLPRRVNAHNLDAVAAAFPSHIHNLGWSSVKTMTNHLRNKPDLPIAVGLISWHGPWVARWCGRDSDMFFVFVKYYHILAEKFYPVGLFLPEKSLAPGFVLVHAQIMSVLEATLHRKAVAEPPPITFDEVLAGADATATSLPLPSSNSTRLMAENRLVMLLRDFVSDRSSDYALARITFAETFSKTMQATARRTSIYNHSSCFLLCDFLEEALMIYMRFYHTHELENDFIDWSFWLEVCKRMLESQNTMSELRVFAFLYTTWSVVTAEERRREAMCVDWLLEEETFDKYFNHWCPMVRAYYMRLLCWRLCRDDGESTELDTKIFSLVLQRLKGNFAKFIFLRQQADKSNILPPSTLPSLPAPGRRLLILRNDNQLPTTNLFVGFDGIISSSNSSKEAAAQPRQSTIAFKRSSLATLAKLDTVDDDFPKLTPDTPTTPSKKRWTFMGKMLPANLTIPYDNSSSPTRGTSPTKTLEEARRETALARSRPPMHSKSSSSDSETPPSTSTHQIFSFKFSLEWAQHFAKRDEMNQSQGIGIRGSGGSYWNERQIPAPRLPAAAQTWIGSRVPVLSTKIVPQNPGAGPNAAEKLARAKYSGRALSEWTIIVLECNNFSDRRREEGVPSLKWVEVPTLGVEGLRKYG